MSEIVVVGAGPAGSATALLLARAGRAVRIVERARFPRRKVCGEYLNAGAVEALDRLGVLAAVQGVASPLRGVRIAARGAPIVALPFSRTALSCPRETLDAILLDAALVAGAQLERARVEDVVVVDRRCAGVLMRRDDGALVERRAQLVVGADGIGSRVARAVGLSTSPSPGVRYAVGGHYAGLAAADGWIEMFAAGGAYFALNPLDAERTNVMIVVPKEQLARWSSDVDAGLRDAAAELGRGVRSFGGGTRIGGRVSIGPLSHRVRRATAPGAILVGDAAGFLDPFTGQGVFLALTGAERAATAIVTGDIGAYERWRRRDFARRARLAAMVKLLVDVPPLARRVAGRIARCPRAAAPLVDALGGAIPPERAFAWSVLGRLLA